MSSSSNPILNQSLRNLLRNRGKAEHDQVEAIICLLDELTSVEDRVTTIETSGGGVGDLTGDEIDAIRSGPNPPNATNYFMTLADVASTGLTTDQQAAIVGSTAPSATNVFITQSELTAQIPPPQLTATEVAAINNANTPNSLNPFATIADLTGLTLPTNQLDALNGSNSPSASNVYATIADIPTIPPPELTPDEQDAIQGANSPSASNVFVTFDDLVSTGDLTADQKDALDLASAPSASNPYATIVDLPAQLNDLNDVTLVGETTRDLLIYNGSIFVNGVLVAGDIPEAGVTQYNAVLDHSALLPSSLATDDHLQYIRVDAGRAFTAPIGGVDPTAATHLATKFYVDAALGGLIPREAVQACADTDTALSGLQLIDGANTAAGTRVLLVGQSNSVENGIWEVQAGAWTRPADLPTGGNVAKSVVYVLAGTQYGTTKFVTLAESGSDVIDTDPQPWTQFDGTSDVIVGNGLVKNGNLIEAVGGNGIAVAPGLITVQENEIDHGSLNPLSLSGDHHSLYVPTTATRGFSAPVEGQDPTASNHLATKFYVDSVVSGSTLTPSEIDAIQGATSPSASNVFITQSDLDAAVSPDQSDAMDNAELPSGANPFTTESRVNTLIAGAVGSSTQDTLSCAATVAVNDFVYVSSAGTVSKAGVDVDQAAEGVVIDKPTANTCVVEWGTAKLAGLVALGLSGGEQLYLADSTDTPNFSSTFNPVLSQELGRMLDSNTARIFVDRTELRA